MDDSIHDIKTWDKIWKIYNQPKCPSVSKLVENYLEYDFQEHDCIMEAIVASYLGYTEFDEQEGDDEDDFNKDN